MPVKKHHIKLDADEREQLKILSRSRTAAAVKVQRAKAMLAMDCCEGFPALSDLKVGKVSGLSVRSLQRLRERVCEVGPLGALLRKPRLTPPVEPKVTGEVEAMMVKIACSEVPAAASRWTMKMVAGRLIELEVIESVSSESESS
ncbi:MAG: helix-turn-helix domain-containing protein, partial [Verrucomicrobiales bacterium]